MELYAYIAQEIQYCFMFGRNILNFPYVRYNIFQGTLTIHSKFSSMIYWEELIRKKGRSGVLRDRKLVIPVEVVGKIRKRSPFRIVFRYIIAVALWSHLYVF